MGGLVNLSQLLTSMGLVMAVLLFAYMTLVSRNPDLPRWKSLKFGLSLVTTIWLIPEVAANFLPEFIPYPTSEGGDYGGGSDMVLGIGVWIHATSMAVFSLYIIAKAIGFLRVKEVGRKVS